MSEPSNPSPFDRRSFFRKLFLRGVDEVSERAHALGDKLKPLAPFINEEHHAGRSTAAEGGATGEGTTGEPGVDANDAVPLVRLRFLRPPGAITPDALFLETCSRCGECVKACPAQCIRLDGFEGSPGLPRGARDSSAFRAGDSHAPRAGGAPFIIARESPCVVCSDLSCMKVCPTGALKLVEAVEAISMGVAVVDHERCLRGVGAPTLETQLAPEAPHVHAGLRDEPPSASARAVKEDCRLCIESCPLGAAAIGLDGDSRIEIRRGCIGCGVCERACPTEPASVWVEPA